MGKFKDLIEFVLAIILWIVIYYYFYWVFRGGAWVSLNFDQFAPDFLKQIVHLISSILGGVVFAVIIGAIALMIAIHHIIIPFGLYRHIAQPIKVFAFLTIFSFVGGWFIAHSFGHLYLSMQEQTVIHRMGVFNGIVGLISFISSCIYYSVGQWFKKKFG